ncbi:c-type cytochrome [Idiomarina seosinensis]|uniref:Cytochrome C n=1 Tax=Idiomarina seosinensis TaxID=281739 RepID=A0A432ZIT6_9GAMM|nr:cytochrome c [Idiomarina seosinensis]RUO77858.1 cytochrome C [Idiomarina seosinensis]
MSIHSLIKVSLIAASIAGLFFTQPADASSGENLYKKYCQACHQPSGKGMQGVFPPLASNSNLKDNPHYIAEVIIKGKSGPITVNGTQYNGSMPAMGYLKDADIAALVNYINTQLSQGSQETTADAVSSLR